MKFSIDAIKPEIEDNSEDEGTTGDEFIINCSVKDISPGVDKVYLEYWFGSGQRTNLSISKVSDHYLQTLILPLKSLDPLHYIIHAVDRADNWNQTDNRTVVIIDNDVPSFNNDMTPLNGTTGDGFTIKVDVTDNIAVSNVSVEYWFGSGPHFIGNMTYSDLHNYYIVLPENSLDSLNYFFKAVDGTGNKASSIISIVTIFDNDQPVFRLDSSSKDGTTGGSFGFYIEVTDNIEVENVFVEYWFGTGSHLNRSMDGPYPFHHNISLPMNNVEPMSYMFHATDVADNWAHTLPRTRTILDTVRPVFGTDSTAGSGTTGDQFFFNIEVMDNIGVKEVYVEIWSETGVHTNTSLNLTVDQRYACSINLPNDSVSDLFYLFHAYDLSGNHETTQVKTVTILDNKRPELIKDDTLNQATTGDFFVFSVSVTDNIEVESVHVEYWFGSGEHNNATMQLGSNWEHGITIPSDSNEALSYIFRARDTSGNWATTMKKVLDVIDNDQPTIEDLTTSVCTTGDPFDFVLKVTDNIGTRTVKVEHWLGISAHTVIQLTLVGTEYRSTITGPVGPKEKIFYIVRAKDTSDNELSTQTREIPVKDNDPPMFGADTSSTKAVKGSSFTFSIPAADNDGLNRLTLEYWFDDGEHVRINMTVTNEHKIEIGSEGITLHYRFIAEDVSGNEAISDTVDIEVEDGESPADPSNTGMIVIIAALIIVILAIVGVAAFLLLRKNKKNQDTQEPTAKEDTVTSPGPKEGPSPNDASVVETTIPSEPQNNDLSIPQLHEQEGQVTDTPAENVVDKVKPEPMDGQVIPQTEQGPMET